MTRISMYLLTLLVLFPAIIFAEVTKKVVEKYPSLSSGETTIPGNPKTIVYLNSKGKEVARELCDETGKVTKTIGTIPDGVIKEYYEDGALLAAYNYRGGKLEGTSKGYFRNGTLRGEWTYKNGKLEGKIMTYYTNGILNLELTYKNDVRDGISKFYNKDGKLSYEWRHKVGELEGVSKGYYESGALRVEYNYQDGKRHGISKTYHKNGELQLIEIYENGKISNKTEYDSKGNLISGPDQSVEKKKGE